MSELRSDHFLRVMRALTFASAASAAALGCSAPDTPDRSEAGIDAADTSLAANCPADTSVDRTPCDQVGQSCGTYAVTNCTRCGYNAGFCGYDSVTCRCEVADGGTTPTWSCTAACSVGPLEPPESAEV